MECLAGCGHNAGILTLRFPSQASAVGAALGVRRCLAEAGQGGGGGSVAGPGF